jgi:4-hydroxy-3-methylbut-2-enyl diphosphate reductase
VPEVLVRDVLSWLAERGYGTVEPVVSAEESLLFALPTELRRDIKRLSGTDAGEIRHDAAFEDLGSLH